MNLNKLDVFGDIPSTKEQRIVTRKEITEDIANRIYAVICETQSDDNLTMYYSSTTLDINGDEGRVYIRVYRDELQIAYIVFKHRRKGTCTKLLSECKLICKELGLTKILMESVLTNDMECFCKKHGFNLKDEPYNSSNKNYILEVN